MTTIRWRVVLRDIRTGERLQVRTGTGFRKITASAAIPLGHKIAMAATADSAPVVKYGSVISPGDAGHPQGDHVHVHNIVSQRVVRRP